MKICLIKFINLERKMLLFYALFKCNNAISQLIKKLQAQGYAIVDIPTLLTKI